jgi:two-component system, OmpR family, response regulator CssR
MQNTQPKIFVVEDNAVFQTLILKQLENISQDVQVFSTGESFLAELVSQPDLIILDYHLAGDMNGYDILKELKKLPFPTPVIFFSNNLELTITSSILKLGVVEYIEKNIFTLARLKDSVKQVLKTSMNKILPQL